MQFLKFRFGIKRIDVRNAARHKAKNDMLRFGGMMSRVRVRSRIQHRRKRNRAETG